MKYKVAFKGEGTKKTGKEIIAKLESLGGVNTMKWDGITTYYYYINAKDNIIDFTTLGDVQDRKLKILCLKTCTLIPLESTQKLFKLL